MTFPDLLQMLLAKYGLAVPTEIDVPLYPLTASQRQLPSGVNIINIHLQTKRFV